MSNINNNLPIAFFDSGIGGITVFEQLKKILPDENYVYFGDNKNMPYGEKTEEQLIMFADNIFRYFETLGVKAVVMACNTTSAITYEKLKNNYNFEIYPIVQSVAKVISDTNCNKIGVFATRATINSNAYSKELKKYNPDIEVLGIACPDWVKIVEEKRENSPESFVSAQNHMEEMLKFNPEKIILGCTHYPYLLDVLKNFAPENIFINPAIAFADFIKKDLTDKKLLNLSNKAPVEKFYASASPEGFQKAASMFYELKVTPELLVIN